MERIASISADASVGRIAYTVRVASCQHSLGVAGVRFVSVAVGGGVGKRPHQLHEESWFSSSKR